MGRKHAPQPLSLTGAESTSPTASIADSRSYPTTASSTLNSPESTARTAAAGPAATSTATTTTSATTTINTSDSLHVASPASTQSSPRSPYSKFNANRKSPANSADPHNPPPPQPPRSAGISRPIQHHQSGSDPPLPKTSAGLQKTPTYDSASPRTRQEKEKHSRNGSRFFSFSKSSSKSHLHQDFKDASPTPTSKIPAVPTDRAPPSRNPKLTADAEPSDIKLVHTNSLPTRTDTASSSTTDGSGKLKKNKPVPFSPLDTSRSTKNKDGSSPREAAGITTTTLSVMDSDRSDSSHQLPLRTAPMQPEGQDRAFRHMMDSNVRTHSADRAGHRERDVHPAKETRHDERDHRAPQHIQHSNQHHTKSQSSSIKESNSSNFFSGLKNSGTRAVDMVSRNFFSKGHRTGSTTDSLPPIDDDHYVLKVINKPLVDQTRLTRISKRLEESRDKTEFWMPAFPWRAIDYLNFKGCEVEGLYRVPGSGPQIKKWQRKFDEEHDVDLFKQEDLYDINIIGSMLKAWLRELPDELFPKEAQERISRECANTDEVPKLLIDELSNLPPFNYYLLFAITCHLSLLLAHAEKNKMDFRNLCICFQPCMKIDAFCFKFLVCNWRECWQGCKNEAKYIEEEYKAFDQPPPPVLRPDHRNRSTSRNGANSPNDRSVSADSRGQRSRNGERHPEPSEQPSQPNGKGRRKEPPTDQSGNTLTVANDPNKKDFNLSPIKPLSPMNF